MAALRRWALSLIVVVCLVATLSAALPASAPAAHKAAAKGTAGGTGAKAATKKAPKKAPKTATEKREEKEENGEVEQLSEVPEGSTSSSLASELGSSGQVDPISGLGLHNPVCDQPGEIHSKATRLACETEGMPESLYPASNYGFDVFIPTGVTHPVGDIMAGLTSVMNGVWLGLLFVLKLVLTLLGLAFSLNPFSNGPTMAKISEGLQRIYTAVTDPWLSALVVCAGVWLAYKGLIKREVSASVGGTVLGVVLLVLGLWIVNRPRETVGELASFSEEVALSVISAPQSGGLSHPVGSFAEATSRMWDQVVEVPFAGLDFSDVKWALGPPPEEAVKKADEAFCEDNEALKALAMLQHLGIGDNEERCAHFAEARYGKPQSVVDLYLRSAPNSAARSALWNYFDNDETYKAKVAAQGGDGVITRLSMLALFAIGLAGVVFLLAWLAIRLFTQAAIAFVLLLVAPFALFFPLLGDAGRHAFKEWGLTLLGAVLAKVIYAAFLSVVMLGITVLGTSLGGGATGFLLSAAFCWAVFFERRMLVGFMTIEPRPTSGGASMGGELAAYKAAQFGGRLIGSPLRVAGGIGFGIGRRTGRLIGHRMRMGGEGTREAARGGLADGARALADERYDQAKETIKRYKGQSSRPSTGTAGSADSGGSKTGGSTESATSEEGRPNSSGSPDPSGTGDGSRSTGPGPSGADDGGPRERKSKGGGAGSSDGDAGASEPEVSEEEFRRAERLVSRADDRESRLGERWTKNDLARFAEEDQHLLRKTDDPAVHAHRAAIPREEFEAMKGAEREEAEAKIEAARHRDERRVKMDDDPAGVFAGRPRQAVERWRQGFLTPERRQALRRVRRENRAERVARRRRNLSRGG